MAKKSAKTIKKGTYVRIGRASSLPSRYHRRVGKVVSVRRKRDRKIYLVDMYPRRLSPLFVRPSDIAEIVG